MKKIALYFITLIVLVSCSSLAIEEHIVGNYYFIATDDGDACSLSYKELNEIDYGGVIKATVFAVGYDERFMIVKQHPREFPNPPNKKITNYYILPMKEGFDYRTKNGLIGPLTELEFKEKRKELGVPEELTFTKVIEDLE